MLKSLVVGLLALLAATFGLHHNTAAIAPTTRSQYADTGLIHSAAQTASVAIAAQQYPAAPQQSETSGSDQNDNQTTTTAQTTSRISQITTLQFLEKSSPPNLATPASANQYATLADLTNVENWVRAQLVAQPTSTVPQQVAAGGANGLAAASNIGNLSNVSISTPSISGGTISNASLNGVTGLTTSDLNDFNYASSSSYEEIAAWGDSLTYGFGGNSYPSQLSALTGYYIYNGGESGDSSTQIATRMLAATNTYSWPTIIWAGYNNRSNEAQVDADIASMVAALQSVGNNNYIILSILNSNAAPSGSADYNQIIQDNNDLAAIYGSHFLDVRSYLVSQYDPTQPQDVIDHGNDVPPNSLRFDAVHMNTAGYLKVAQYIDQHMSLLVPSSATPVLTTQNLGALFDDPPSFAFVDSAAGYEQDSNLILSASPTNHATLVGIGAGIALTTAAGYNTAVGFQALYSATSSATYNTALGYFALNQLTSGSYNTAVGNQALGDAVVTGNYNTAVGSGALSLDTSGSSNTAVGKDSLADLTTGGTNTAIGRQSLEALATGSSNTALGYDALLALVSGSSNTAVGTNAASNSTGNSNTALGYNALLANTTGTSNVALGRETLANNASATSSVAIGYQAGIGTTGSTASQNNVFVGYQSGFSNTIGSNNLLLGYKAGNSLTSGASNIILGYDVDVPSASGSQQLDIGNTLYGTGIYNGSTASSVPVSTGRIAIGSSTASARFTVWGTDAASSTPALDVVNSASSTVFSIFDGGNAVLSGSLSQSSDQRLKTDVQSLDASSSLSLLEQLNPVSYLRIDQPGGGENLGFLAQQVESVFPELVSTTSPTALTPDGTLTLNYTGLIAPIISAIQDLANEISSLESTVAGFAESFISQQITATNEFCVGSTCVTPTQFAAMVAAAGQAGASSEQGSSSSDVSATSTPDTPPFLQINGDNPAIVQVGAPYNDLGATITGPQADLNLGIATYLNGIFESPLEVDTSQPATDTIDYVATDSTGLAATTTRTVIIQAPAADDSNAVSFTATSTPS